MLRGILAVFIGAASYGALSTIAKLSYKEGFNPIDATLFQILFGFLVLLILNLFAKSPKGLFSLDKTEYLKLSFGGLAIVLTSLFYYSCVQYIPASIGIILLFQFIWIGYLLDALLNGKKPTKVQWLTLVVLMAGTLLASGIFSSDGISNLNGKGLVLGFLAALCYASYIFINGRLKADISPVAKSSFMMGVGSFIALILLFNHFSIEVYTNPEFLKFGIPLAMLGAVIPPVLFAYGVPKIGVTKSSILSSVELPIAVLCSISLLGESVSFVQWIGILLILLAIIGSSLIKK